VRSILLFRIGDGYLRGRGWRTDLPPGDFCFSGIVNGFRVYVYWRLFCWKKKTSSHFLFERKLCEQRLCENDFDPNTFEQEQGEFAHPAPSRVVYNSTAKDVFTWTNDRFPNTFEPNERFERNTVYNKCVTLFLIEAPRASPSDTITPATIHTHTHTHIYIDKIIIIDRRTRRRRNYRQIIWKMRSRRNR